MKIRAKTVIKLQTPTVNYDLSFEKGAELNTVIWNLVNLVHDTSTIDDVLSYVGKQKLKIAEYELRGE